MLKTNLDDNTLVSLFYYSIPHLNENRLKEQIVKAGFNSLLLLDCDSIKIFISKAEDNRYYIRLVPKNDNTITIPLGTGKLLFNKLVLNRINVQLFRLFKILDKETLLFNVSKLISNEIKPKLNEHIIFNPIGVITKLLSNDINTSINLPYPFTDIDLNIKTKLFKDSVTVSYSYKFNPINSVYFDFNNTLETTILDLPKTLCKAISGELTKLLTKTL